VNPLLEVECEGEIIYWRGPAPFYFVKVAERESSKISAIANQVTYGWGVLPVEVKIAGLEFYTALFPKDGGYLLPLKKALREELKVDLGDVVLAQLTFNHGK